MLLHAEQLSHISRQLPYRFSELHRKNPELDGMSIATVQNAEGGKSHVIRLYGKVSDSSDLEDISFDVLGETIGLPTVYSSPPGLLNATAFAIFHWSRLTFHLAVKRVLSIPGAIKELTKSVIKPETKTRSFLAGHFIQSANRGSIGTLGGFLTIQDGHYLVTCAHVLFGCPETSVRRRKNTPAHLTIPHDHLIELKNGADIAEAGHGTILVKNDVHYADAATARLADRYQACTPKLSLPIATVKKGDLLYTTHDLPAQVLDTGLSRAVFGSNCSCSAPERYVFGDIIQTAPIGYETHSGSFVYKKGTDELVGILFCTCWLSGSYIVPIDSFLKAFQLSVGQYTWSNELMFP